MPEVTEYAPGTFCWIELHTTDPRGATEFYTSLLGVNAEESPIPGGGAYTTLSIDDKPVAGLNEMQPDMRAQGVPPNWLSYVAVKSADEIAGKVESLGGTLIAPAFDVMDMGRMAMVQDPSGGVLGIWQAKNLIGAMVTNQHGALSWTELLTNDVEAAIPFYTGLFGWSAKTEDYDGQPYTMYSIGDDLIAGCMSIQPEWGQVPPHWAIYLAVDDADKIATQTQELGGQVRVPPMDIAYGRMAWLSDPQGAAVNIIQLADKPQQ